MFDPDAQLLFAKTDSREHRDLSEISSLEIASAAEGREGGKDAPTAAAKANGGSGEMVIDDDSASSKSLTVGDDPASSKSYEMILNLLPTQKLAVTKQPEEKVSDTKSVGEGKRIAAPIRAASVTEAPRSNAGILKLQHKKSSSLTRKAPAG